MIYRTEDDCIALSQNMLDLTNRDPNAHLEIELRQDGKVLWINFEGVCVFRACGLNPQNIKLKGIPA
jgi:hypothetical protein